MFPTPIERASRPINIGYRIVLPIALIVWLLQLIAVMLTSMRSLADITSGNYWGLPTEFALIETFATVFAQPITPERVLKALGKY